MDKPEDKKAVKSLPEHIADMPEAQRKSMEKARSEGKFEAKTHLDRSPIGKAAAKGFPIPKR
ncbi:hypothetical protein [Teredinibacter turnerae]|uniref:hypothetical protein n=1 Tax=Teredinibacter turnerae TaxID=2426 RepID=UPI0003FD69D8|nr:hypothetical protein [Teredinibacter turnerae]